MGALTRATLSEIDELVAGDPSWWPGLCMKIAESGLAAAVEEKSQRGWAWGALWGWIVGDEARYGEYSRALEAYTQLKAHEAVGIADGVAEDKAAVAKATLRVNTRFRYAGKVDRVRWGDKVEGGGTVVLVDAGLVGFAGALLE